MAAMPLSPDGTRGMDLACGRKGRSGSAPSSSGHSVWQRFKVYQSLPPSSKTTLWPASSAGRLHVRDDPLHPLQWFVRRTAEHQRAPGPALGLIRTRLPTSSPALVSTSSAALALVDDVDGQTDGAGAPPKGRFFRGGPAGLGFALGSFALDDLDARPCGITSI